LFFWWCIDKAKYYYPHPASIDTSLSTSIALSYAKSLIWYAKAAQTSDWAKTELAQASCPETSLDL